MRKMTFLKNKIENMPLQVKASAAFVICSFMQRGISTLTTPIFTRILTTEQYGYYSIFNSWLDILAVFTTLKLAGGVFTQALIKFESRRDELTASTAGLGTTLTLCSMVLYIPFRNMINPLLGMNTLIMLCIFIASWATLMFELWASRQRVEYQYKSIVALTLFTSVAKPFFGIIAVLSTQTYKAEARIVSLVFVEVLSYFGLFAVFLKRGKTFFHKQFWKYFLSLNIPLIPHYLTRTVLNQSDRLMINIMVGYSSAGIYSLAYNLAWMLNLITTSILNTFNPWMYQRMKKKEFHRIGPFSYFLLGIVAVCVLGFVSIAPELIKIFAPIEYYEAMWVIPPVTASVYFLFMYSLYANFEFYFEKSKFMMAASTIGGLLNIILNYIFIKLFGYIAAGYTTLICYIFYSIAHYYCMKRIAAKELHGICIYDMKKIILISSGMLLSTLFMMMLYKNPIIRYGVLFVMIFMIYLKRYRMFSVIKELKKN